jgi:protein-S-isoprenylcysteine O-methyltransferase Ste14
LRTIVLAVLLLCWIAWCYPFVFRAPRGQKRASITVAWPTRIGLLLEISAFAVAFVFHLPGLRPASAVRTVLGMSIAVPAVVMVWQAVAHLGKQLRVYAGLYEDHELVRSGPYAIVRHPIYASLLAMLVANCLLLTRWWWALVALVVFIIGTEIRVRAEDRLLASRFPGEFAAYRRRVPAYLPFVR